MRAIRRSCWWSAVAMLLAAATACGRAGGPGGRAGAGGRAAPFAGATPFDRAAGLAPEADFDPGPPRGAVTPILSE